MRRMCFGVSLLLALLFLSAFSRGISTMPGIIGGSSTDSIPEAPASPLQGISNHTLKVLDGRYSQLNKLIQSRTEKMLARMEKKELALQSKLQGRDSLKARALFKETHIQYQQFLAKLQARTSLSSAANPLKQYIPGIDSMQTALRFLSQSGGSGTVSLPASQWKDAQAASQQLQQLQGKLQQANEVQAFISQREQQLKNQFTGSGVGKQLLGVNLEAYYYQAQLAQYKGVLNDPDKRQQAVLSAVRQSPYFQQFWQKSSYWSSLFPAPADPGTPQALAGLQTREQVQQDVQRKLGRAVNPVHESGGGGEGGTGLPQQMQHAVSQLKAIKDKLAQFGSGGSGTPGNSNMTMPDFQPNNQRTKTLWKRLQYSFTIQNTANTGQLPAISSPGISIGYKLRDNVVIGLGGSYLLGIGNGLNHIRFTNQGVGIKSFVDIHARGNFWITGAFEYNYMEQFAGIRDIPNLHAWQHSALIGVTKKYTIGKKENNLQLLYDVLANSEVPKGQSLQFRMGWGL